MCAAVAAPPSRFAYDSSKAMDVADSLTLSRRLPEPCVEIAGTSWKPDRRAFMSRRLLSAPTIAVPTRASITALVRPNSTDRFISILPSKDDPVQEAHGGSSTSPEAS